MNSRRTFIKRSGLFAFSISTFAMIGCKSDDSGALVSDCATTEDILGPFYRTNALIRTNLIIAGHSTPELIVKGEVYQADCTSLLPDAKVEFWQSDTEGNYDNESDDFNFRGSQISDEDGSFLFKTVIPGRYLNGSTYRPSHIHFKITANGYKDLISQIYFKDDPFINSDPWASNPTAQERILEMIADDNGIETVHFPIYMTQV